MRKTVYIAQAFHWIDGKLQPGEFYQYAKAERAAAAGASLSVSAPGVAVFSLDGHPDTDVWEDPVILARYGVAPRAA